MLQDVTKGAQGHAIHSHVHGKNPFLNQTSALPKVHVQGRNKHVQESTTMSSNPIPAAD